MRLDVISHIFLLGLSLAVAYWSTSSKEDYADSAVAVYDLPKSKVTNITYRSEEKTVAITRQEPSARFIITQTVVKKSKKEPEKEPTEEKNETTFVANEEIEKVLDFLEPLRALRMIGKVDDATLDEFGLKESKETLSIASGDKQINFILGKKGYGSQNQFILDETNNKAMLINGVPFGKVIRASQSLFERKILDLEWETTTEAVVKAGEKTKALFFRSPDGSAEKTWVGEKEDLEASKTYSAWIDKLKKLRVVRYAKSDELADLTNIDPLFIVELTDEDKKTYSLAFFKQSKVTDSQNEEFYWVKSSYLGMYVVISKNRASILENDLKLVVN